MTEQADVLVFRPRRLMVISVALSLGLLALTAVGWLALPGEIRDLFSVSQRVTLLGLLGFLIFVMMIIAFSRVRADSAGLRLRNGLRTHVVAWDRVHKIMLRPGDPWGIVLLKPSDGRPFEADLDAEKRQMMGIQANDGDRARESIAALQRAFRSHGRN